ncbi:MAG TPA: hypothetical protein VD967_00750 [Candidatus Paceibacterota bacterium]|nr:hypothetical protein [Candidatus Paceibacterota bacterium]
MSDIEQKDKEQSAALPEARSYQNTALFKGNDGLLFAFKKSQKLASAIYLVTDFLSLEEKLRQDLRELSVLLIKDILASAASRAVMPATRILEILSLLEVASGARMISPMNAEVLKREYEQVLGAVEGVEMRSAPPVPLSEEFLRTDVLPPVPFASPRPPESPRGASPSPSPDKEDTAERRAFHIGHKGQSAPMIKERALSIFELIKKSPQPLSIKDIAGHIRGVGEKTIQRELSALVAQGVLKREGERRWSRYSPR